jgi:transcriptional regulator with XRE-family HTH domain
MYNSHFIKKVLKLRKTLSISKLAAKFNISTRTIQNWEQGKLPKGKRNKPNKTLDKLLLIQDIEQYPDSYQYERAERLGVSQMCIWYNLKKLSITYKKNTESPQSRRRKAIIVPEKD